MLAVSKGNNHSSLCLSIRPSVYHIIVFNPSYLHSISLTPRESLSVVSFGSSICPYFVRSSFRRVTQQAQQNVSHCKLNYLSREKWHKSHPVANILWCVGSATFRKPITFGFEERSTVFLSKLSSIKVPEASCLQQSKTCQSAIKQFKLAINRRRFIRTCCYAGHLVFYCATFRDKRKTICPFRDCVAITTQEASRGPSWVCVKILHNSRQ